MGDNADFDLSQDEVSTLAGVSMFFSALSLLGSGFIICCYLKFHKLRTFPFKLVCMLSVNDFLNQVGDFLQPTSTDVLAARTGDDPSALCVVQAWTESFFELASVLWTTSIAFSLYMSVFKRKSQTELDTHYFKWMVAFCWGLPLLLAVIPGAAGMYGGAGAWCWIKPGHVEWRFIQFYIPLWCAIAFNASVYVAVIRTIKNMAKAATAAGRASSTAEQMLQSINRLRWYPLILVVVWGFATINRVYESVAESNLFWLTVLQKSFSSLQGLLNAVAYGMSVSIRTELVKQFPFLRRVCPGRCCGREESDEDQWASNPVASASQGLQADASGDNAL